MHHLFLLVFSLATVGNSYSQNPATAPGYYVSLNNDTIAAQVKLPTSFFSKTVILSKFLDKVDFVDGEKGMQTFKPGEIKSYGFSYSSTTYRFYSPRCSKNFSKFLQALVLGKKTNLYTFQTVDANGHPLGAVYTFEKADGSCTFLNIAERRLEIFKRKLIEFYKDDVALQQLIHTKFVARSLIERDIVEIVDAANK